MSFSRTTLFIYLLERERSDLTRRAVTCVFPGRFQPFHNGHAEALCHAASLYGRVIVTISNAHISHTDENPFTGGERYEMIERFALGSSIERRVIIVPIPLDDKPTTWVATILSVCPRFDDVYTRSAWTQSLFAHWSITNSTSLLAGNYISASDVRRAMADGDDWKCSVPPPVADTLEELGGPARVRSLLRGKNHRLSAQ